jgi:hypothetical protein
VAAAGQLSVLEKMTGLFSFMASPKMKGPIYQEKNFLL